MSQPVRISVNGSDMPFLFRDAQRAVLVPRAGIDNVGNVPHADQSPDYNAPQLMFVENVMPIARGIVATRFSELISADNAKQFDQAIVLRDSHENNALFTPAGGANYLLSNTTGLWTSSNPFSFLHKLITRAYVAGRSFVMYEKERLYEYNGSTGAVDNVTSSLVLPTGYAISDIRGCGAASNYLLLFTDIGILWSSPSDPLNFDSSLNNGSGQQIPQDVRGQISAILPVSGGAIIYTVRNAVAIFFTNSAATPFVFKGISNAGGVASYEQVAYDADEKFQYVWGSGGFQSVSLQGANPVFPEVSDFLTSFIYETYDYTNNVVVSQKLGSNMSVKLTFVSNRFLVVSYGPVGDIFTHALIFDSALQRWGKVKIDHVDAISYPYPNIAGDLTYDQLVTSYEGLGDASYDSLGVGILSISPPKRTIAFLGLHGNIEILSVDYLGTGIAQSVAIFGQLAHNRNKFTTLDSVELDGLDDVVDGRLFILNSIDGRNIARVTEFLTYGLQTGDYKNFLGEETGRQLCISVVGSFQLTSLIASVSQHAKY